MNYFNHAKHTLSQLEGFLHDAMNEENISAEEIYDVIIENVASDVEHYQMQYQKSERLFNLLKGYVKPETETEEEPEEPEKYTYGDMIAKGYWMSADGFWMPPEKKEDKVKSWILPVDDEGVVTLPEDLLKRSGWKEGDVLVYEVCNGNVLVRKKEPMTHTEMIAAGYTMTDDGFWILTQEGC